MAYFEEFPLVEYQFGKREGLVVNITREVKVLPQFEDSRYFMEYEIGEGETPIILADRLYDDELLDWTILHFNKVIDPYSDWPVDMQTLRSVIQDKYTDPYGIHHYISASTGNEVPDTHPTYDRVPVTNYEHEVNENDSKRNIKLIVPQFIGEYVAAHESQVEVII